ncbi:protein kinase domain protein [Metarhizium anisopliae]|nr:protein kinase domain protein [Metarhizium anisopliae]
MGGFGKRPFSLSAKRPAAYVLPEPIDEELLTNGRLKYFHPTRPGQILDGRFKTIAKLGFGSGSTVWLAENLAYKRWAKSSGPRYVSIKISALDANAADEIRWMKLISKTNPSHEGLSHIRTPIDVFNLQDIKDDNIMVTLEDDSVLKDLVQYYKTNSQPKHVRNEDGRVTYLSHDELVGAIYLLSNLIGVVPQRCFSVVRGHTVLIYGISA